MGKAVDRVRKQEHRTLRVVRDETLTGITYLWLYAEKHRERFATHKGPEPQGGTGWAIKESLRELWAQDTPPQAAGFWPRWF